MDERTSEKPFLRDKFREFSHAVAGWVGTPQVFMFALFAVIGWLLTGPLFGFSDTWQLVINTATTIVTFLMVFLIQNSQNRDSRAFHLKLDELIRGVKGARTERVNLEEMTDAELEKMQCEFRELHQKLDTHLTQRRQK